jgi:hypothetical protein
LYNLPFRPVRRSFVAHLVEELDVTPHVVEVLVNHIPGHKGGVAAIYNRATYWPKRVADAEARGRIGRWGREGEIVTLEEQRGMAGASGPAEFNLRLDRDGRAVFGRSWDFRAAQVARLDPTEPSQPAGLGQLVWPAKRYWRDAQEADEMKRTFAIAYVIGAVLMGLFIVAFDLGNLGLALLVALLWPLVLVGFAALLYFHPQPF